jgi:hypothetical protein
MAPLPNRQQDTRQCGVCDALTHCCEIPTYASPAPTDGSTHTCRMVGRPWGQFQGAVSPASRSRIPLITLLSRAVPIMIEERQAREASMARTLQAYMQAA